MKNWTKSFDKKFTRKDISTNQYEDSFFIKEYITSKEIKQFISDLLKKQKLEYDIEIDTHVSNYKQLKVVYEAKKKEFEECIPDW